MVQVVYYENCVSEIETFDEADINTNLSRAIQYALALREMGGDFIKDVGIFIDI